MADAAAFDVVAAAETLLAGRAARQKVAALPGLHAPAQGIAVQRAIAERLHAVPPAGFKVGGTAKGMQAFLKIDHPLAGFMAKENIHPSGASLPFAACVAPGLECELAVRLARDLPAGPCSAEQAIAAVDVLFAAIELVDNRYEDFGKAGPAGMIADQVFQAGAILGEPPADWRAIDLAAVRGRIAIDSAERASGTGAELLGHPMRSLAWLAGSEEAAAFGGLKAGQIVLLGSVTPPIWIDGPCAAEVRFDNLPPVTVRMV